MSQYFWTDNDYFRKYKKGQLSQYSELATDLTAEKLRFDFALAKIFSFAAVSRPFQRVMETFPGGKAAGREE
jgi:hypothetical protein